MGRMAVLHWITNHATSILQSAGIIGSLLVTRASLRRDTRSRHVANLITLTAQHRDIWERFYENGHLTRIRDPKADLKKQPVTPEESLFVNLIILHLNCWYQAIKYDAVSRPERVDTDAGTFFSLPVPLHVWQLQKQYQNADFARFLNDAIEQKRK